MPAFSASAPGKIILFGEHAVVYDQPAIAVPVSAIAATAYVHADVLAPTGQVTIDAPDIGMDSPVSELPEGDPIRTVVENLQAFFQLEHIPACTVRVTSTIPIAAGLGSGAAISIAIIRALSKSIGMEIQDEDVSALAYEVEKIYHGTPSGIDNTVITYRKPVYYVKNQPLETIKIRKPFKILIADTGTRSLTATTVGDVRAGWEEDKTRYETNFKAIGSIVRTARQAIEKGHSERLGPLMIENHELLCELNVSSPELNKLVNASMDAGALGAKLSGGGRGGNMIALVNDECEKEVSEALVDAGATNLISSVISGG